MLTAGFFICPLFSPAHAGDIFRGKNLSPAPFFGDRAEESLSRALNFASGL
jgi:hypothetical protein